MSQDDAVYALDATLEAVCLQVSVERAFAHLDEALDDHFAHLRRYYPDLYAALRLLLSGATGEVSAPLP